MRRAVLPPLVLRRPATVPDEDEGRPEEWVREARYGLFRGRVYIAGGIDKGQHCLPQRLGAGVPLVFGLIAEKQGDQFLCGCSLDGIHRRKDRARPRVEERPPEALERLVRAFRAARLTGRKDNPVRI